MPVSHDYPLERIKTMLKIAESRVALCYGFDEELHVKDFKKIDLAGLDFAKIRNDRTCINTLIALMTFAISFLPPGIDRGCPKE